MEWAGGVLIVLIGFWLLVNPRMIGRVLLFAAALGIIWLAGMIYIIKVNPQKQAFMRDHPEWVEKYGR